MIFQKVTERNFGTLQLRGNCADKNNREGLALDVMVSAIFGLTRVRTPELNEARWYYSTPVTLGPTVNTDQYILQLQMLVDQLQTMYVGQCVCNL